MKRQLFFSILVLPVIMLSTCGSGVEAVKIKREKKILTLFSEEKQEKYADLLVDLKNYTTSGDVYQKKYKKYLIGIASELIEAKKFTIEKGTIGFYYDKKSKEPDKLYLGLDVISEKTYSQNYPTMAISLIKENLRQVMETLNACRSIFFEKEVVGIVVGFKWVSSGYNQNVNVWIVEGDALLFEDSRLTFNELVHRSTITDTKGEIIRLQL